MIELGANRYGKSAIHLVKIVRDGERHHVRDLTVAVALEGDFVSAHTLGDNSQVIATDTMKNTVFALAKDRLDGPIERFGAVLARHFLDFPQVSRATITIREARWMRIPTDDGPAPDAFLRSGDFTRTATVVAEAGGLDVTAGIEDLTVLKTTRSAFTGFARDRLTTLPEAEDRLMATRITATWRYAAGRGASPSDDPTGHSIVDHLDFDELFDEVGHVLLDTFAVHHSPSVQASIWLMGQAILEACPEIGEIRMVLPNLHHWAVDLSPLGIENANEIFVSTTEPHGLIDATVRRGTEG